MTVAEQTALNRHVANGVSTVFAFQFYIPQDSDLGVTVDGVEQTLNVDYTVSGAGNADGGSVTFALAPSNGATVVLYRDMEFTRTTDYQTGGDFRANPTVNADFDRAILLAQQLRDVVLVRGLRAPIGDTLAEMPPAAARANRVLAFDSNGDPTIAVPVDGSAASVLIDLADAAQGDALVAVQAPHPGAVARTQHSKNLESLSLYDFYTSAQIADVDAGTGSIDVSAAINSCLTAAIAQGARTVLVPKGQHRIASNITFPTNVTLFFEAGAELKADSGVTVTINSAVIAGRRRIFNVANGTYQGTFGPQARPEVCAEWWGAIGSGSSTGDGFGIDSAMAAVNAVGGGVVTLGVGTFLIGFQMTARSNVTLRGVSRDLTVLRAVDALNANIVFGTANNCTFENLTIDGNGSNQSAGNGIVFVASTLSRVVGCRIINVFGNGIIFQQDGSNNPCAHVEVSGSHIADCGAHGVSLSLCNIGRVTNNTIRNCGNAGINLGVCSRFVVSGNTIENDANNTSGFGGVRITSDDTTGLSYLNAITGNQIRRFPRGVMLIGAQYTTVSGNTIESSNYEGILSGPNATTSSYVAGYNTIVGNVIGNSGQAKQAGSTAGVSLTGSDYNVVVANSIVDVTSSMEHGVLLAANAQGNALYNEVRSNLIVGFTASAVAAPAANLDRVVLGPNMQAAINVPIASAATITLPPTGDVFTITGTTDISAINGGWVGRLVTLQFSGALTVTDGGGAGNLNLAGNYVTAAGSVLTLRHTGGQWIEVARSNN